MYDMDIQVKNEDLLFILYRFDKNRDGKITFNEVRPNNLDLTFHLFYSSKEKFYLNPLLTIDYF